MFEFFVVCILGLIFGSFANVCIYRMPRNMSVIEPNSHCTSCNAFIKWYDNIPILSWVCLRGKCRFCHEKIGASEIVSEVLTGVVFLVLGKIFFDSYDAALSGDAVLIWSRFAVLCILSLFLVFLAIYDGKWGELPTVILIIAAVLGGVYWGLSLSNFPEYIYHSLGALAVLAGLYELLYIISKGRWVGDGDALLCIPLALVVGNVWLAVFILFIANTMGCFFAIPSVMRAKNKGDLRHLKIYFGPFLVVAFFVVLLFSEQILSLIVF